MLAKFVFDAATQLGVPAVDVAWLLERLFTLLASCDERRVEQWDLQSWWDYVQAEKRSEPFRRYLADGLTRTLVAARAKEMSARTGGLILVQLLADLSRAGDRADRVLDAPTSDAWIAPWVTYLRGRGVDIRLGEAVTGLSVRDGRIASATVGGASVTADYYVAALPVEVMRTLLSPELRAAEPRLNGLDRLVTRWMNGILFYLAADLPLVNGHAIYLDSEWALTSISQRQFWKTFDYPGIGGILSLDISEWQRAGRRTGKVAAMCTPEEIRTEVWGQLQDHLEGALDGVEVREWFLDEAIEFPNPSGATNAEPLLVNTKGSWADRPDAALRIPNLVLAADYVRTHTDLATMEGANEAARRAVNAILDAVGSSAPRCDVWKLREPPVLGPGAHVRPRAVAVAAAAADAGAGVGDGRGARRRRARAIADVTRAVRAWLARSGCVRPGAGRSVRSRCPSRGRATCWSARCTPASAAGPRRWRSGAACRRARRSRKGTSRGRSSTATSTSAPSKRGRRSCAVARSSACTRTRRPTWCRRAP